MTIESELFIQLNALNRMLTVQFILRIDWYTNRGQIAVLRTIILMCHSDQQPSGTVSVVFTI